MKPNEGFNEVQLHLLAMSALLRDEGAWTRGYTAKNWRGERCDAKDPAASKWCLLGAMERTHEGGMLVGSAFWATHLYLGKAIARTGHHCNSIPNWNDSVYRTHQEVQELILRAVILAGEWVPA